MDPKPGKIIPALYGGVIMALLFTIPFISLINIACCAGIMLGGFLAVFFYKNNFTSDTPPFTSSDCTIVGLIAGNIGAFIASLLELLETVIFGTRSPDEIIAGMKNYNVPPESLEIARQILTLLTGVFGFFFKLVFCIFIFGIFGMIGGLIAYSVFKAKGPQMMPPPPHHEPPSGSL